MTNREKIRNITKKEGKEVLKNKLADLKKEDKTNEEIVKYFEKEYNLIYE